MTTKSSLIRRATMARHLIIASYDGINTHYCGVGTIIRNTISALNDFAVEENIKVSLAFVFANPDGKVFDSVCFEDSKRLVDKTGGCLIPLCNGTLGFTESDMWKSFPEWANECASLGTALNLILRDNEDNVLFLHDTPFLLFTRFRQQVFGKSLRCFYIPHSSGMNHAFGDTEWRRQRVAIEKDAFARISDDHSSMLLAEGRIFAEHLTRDYGVTFKEGAYFTNGLYFGRYDAFRDEKFDTTALKAFGIDINPDARIIFSWGRCSVAKGFKELLEAWRMVADRLPSHYLILQAPNNSGEPDYFQTLKSYEDRVPRTKVIDEFNPQIWQTVLRTPNTDVVCIPSTMDPNPHTAIEAKLFCKGMQYTIVGSQLDGVKDTFNDEECIWVNPYDTDEFAYGLLKAVAISPEEKNAMNRRNTQNMANYDYANRVRRFLKNIEVI